MRKYIFNKLIRDKIPKRMVKEGISVHGRSLSEEEYKKHLLEKLIEEAQEVIDADSKHEVIEEIADVMQVIMALSKIFGFDQEDVEKERLKKLEINGDFDKDCYVDYIEVDENNKDVIDYLSSRRRPYKFVKSSIQ